MREVAESGLKDRIGQCYQLAGGYVIDHPNAILVHGTFNGVRFTRIYFDNNHAWVEENGEVFDPVMDCRFPKEDYYELFHATIQAKYTHDEVCHLTLQTEHWGTWHE
jgi:hypothetical protein